MDIKVRDVDIVAVKKIDQMAKGKGQSRNELLKRHIEKLSHYDFFVEERKRFDESWEESIKVMKAYLEMQEKLYKKVERFEAIVLLLMDADEEEVNDMLVMVGCDEND